MVKTLTEHTFIARLEEYVIAVNNVCHRQLDNGAIAEYMAFNSARLLLEFAKARFILVLGIGRDKSG